MKAEQPAFKERFRVGWGKLPVRMQHRIVLGLLLVLLLMVVRNVVASVRGINELKARHAANGFTGASAASDTAITKVSYGSNKQ